VSRDGFSLDDRDYPRTWFLMDLVEDRPRLLKREVVDLSPAAIELRQTARELKGWADERDRWISLDREGRWERLGERHRRSLSFGPRVGYCVEHDDRGEIHAGRPFRHLVIQAGRGGITPATSAEIALYFYGRRPAAFGFVESGRAHGYVGYEWDPVDQDDVAWLLRRELDPREG